MSNCQTSRWQTRGKSICLPESFFTQALPKLQNLAELKTFLWVVYLIQQKQGRPEFVTYKELRTFEPLVALGEEILQEALDLAIKHGLLLHSVSQTDGGSENKYSLPEELYKSSATNIFTLYEQNIGIITPLVAEELKEAASLYPFQWIEEAFKEAAMLNKRSWRYIARILERWASEGKDSGKHKGDAKKTSPDKYVKGKYGRLVRR